MKSIFAKLTGAVAACNFLFAMSQSAFAQDAPPSDDQSGWFLGYALVVLAIFLGLSVVCRPGRRTADVKVEEE